MAINMFSWSGKSYSKYFGNFERIHALAGVSLKLTRMIQLLQLVFK